jgi:RNA polymerase sigma-70 factor (ECF subfamily)
VEAVSEDLPQSPARRDDPSPGHDEELRGLFDELAAGRVSALDELYDAAASKLHDLALWRTGSMEDAADVVQDVFVRVAGLGQRLARVRNPRAWLSTVTHRVAVDVTRRKSRRRTEAIENCPFLTAATADSDRVLDAKRASRLLAGLPASQRTVIYLRHFASFTFAEIGHIVGVPKFTAASRYRNGIARLRRLMGGKP